MSIPRLLESQKKLCLRFLQDECPTGKFHDSQMFKKALQQQFRMEQQLKNLQDPLCFTKNQKIHKLTSDVQKATQKLRQEVGKSVELSKTFYRNILQRTEQTNGDKGKQIENIFTMEHTVSDPVVINRQSIIKKQEQQNHQKSPLQIYKDSYDNLLQKRSINFKPNKYYRHNQNQQEIREIETEEIQENIQILSEQDKIQCARLNHSQDSELLRFWRPTKVELQIGLTSNLRLDKNALVQRVLNRLQLNLIEGEYSYGQGSNQVYFDFQNNLNFQKTQERIAEQEAKKAKKYQENPAEHILEHFLEFKMKQISCNDIFDVGLRKITPYKIRDYRKYKENKQTNQNSTIDGNDIQDKFFKLTEEYNMAQRRLKKEKKARGLNNKVVSMDCQTIKQLQDNINFMEMQVIEDECLNVCKKLQKFNTLRESVMKNNDKKDKLVFMKNICLEIKELLFQLLFVLVKGQKFVVKQGHKLLYPILNYRQFLEAENRDQVQRKILEIVFANEDNFQMVEIEEVSKRMMLDMYKKERDKNDRILDILQAKIKG